VKLLAVALAAVALAAPAAAATLPPPVAKTRGAILKAAQAHDYAALARVIGARPLTFTYGPATGGPIAYWKRVERQGGRPLARIAAILKKPGVKFQGNYVWPPAYAKPTGPGYYDYRLGISPAGRWLFFVRGD
jgi:hypothetical protein